MTKKQFFFGTLLFVLLMSLFMTPLAVCQEGAGSAIDSAQRAIQNCYQAAKEAESAGANVSSLMRTLNKAADLFSKAELAYVAQDYNAAYTYASQSQNTLNGFTDQASELQQSASAKTSQEAEANLLLLLASVVVFVSGLSTWLVLYRRERRSIHGA
ncbi:MAG: hypothetical protein ACM3UY_00335 [Methanocella sp.]|jgi:hypothetical protein